MKLRDWRGLQNRIDADRQRKAVRRRMFDRDTIIIVAFGVTAFVCLRLYAKIGGNGLFAPPVAARSLMTAIERITINHIEMALPETRVHAQVSKGAILRTRKGLNRSKAATIRNQFSNKRVDYVVEHRATRQIVMLIELDDRSHNPRMDAKRDRMTAAAGYVSLRLPANERPTRPSVDRHIRNAFNADPQIPMIRNGARKQRT